MSGGSIAWVLSTGNLTNVIHSPSIIRLPLTMRTGFVVRHNKYVKTVVPPDRHYFFDVKDGWGPLCKILDVPVPDEPFPNVNDRDAIKASWARLERRSILVWIGTLATPAVAVAGAYIYASRPSNLARLRLGDIFSTYLRT